ncbi:MAG: carbohydrate-binding domain-containing protein [Anaerolineaceae bacterium]
MNKKIIAILITLALLATSACSTNTTTSGSSQPPAVSLSTQASSSSQSQSSASQGTAETSAAATAAEPTAIKTHEEEDDYTWDAAIEVAISLNGTSISTSGAGVDVNGSTAVITSPGTYRLSGSLDNGQILVNTESEETVRLILDGVSISNSSSATINIEKAGKVVLILADGTQNVLSDAQTYTYAPMDVDEPNAALFSKANLTIYGGGSLTVSGNYNDAISSKDGLIIKNAILSVTAVDDGIRGKDYLVLENAVLNVTSGGDGLKSDNDVVEAPGAVLVTSSTVTVSSNGDGICAEGQVEIVSGEYKIQTDSGSANWAMGETSAKGIKGVGSVLIQDGTFTLDTADDAVHSNGSITINGGSFTIASGDDGMHADTTLTILGGEIDISTSYEGLESGLITINGGEIHITSSDDGINVAAGADSSGFQQGGMNPGGGMSAPGGRFDQQFTKTGDYWLRVSGGYIYVNAGGDGVDVNGSAEMSGGTLLVDGPTENMNGPLDYLGTFNITGGVLVASGSAGMAQAPSQSSTQSAILFVFNSALSGGSLFTLQSGTGEAVLTYAPAKSYQSILVSSPNLQTGASYSALLGGVSSGTEKDGVYTGGSTSQASEYTSLTLSSVVTAVGNSTGFGGSGGRRK